MARDHEIPGLVEEYLETAESFPCWVTVREIRARLALDESRGPPIAGFLQRISTGYASSCRYRVSRIEKFEDPDPPYRILCRYLIEQKPPAKNRSRRKTESESQGPVNMLYYSGATCTYGAQHGNR